MMGFLLNLVGLFTLNGLFKASISPRHLSELSCLLGFIRSLEPWRSHRVHSILLLRLKFGSQVKKGLKIGPFLFRT